MRELSRLIEKIRQLSLLLEKHPTGLVMTTETYERICSSSLHLSNPNACNGNGEIKTIRGILIEHYVSIKECLDRMASAGDSEKLLLVLSSDIPVDYFHHPWIKEQIGKMIRVQNPHCQCNMNDPTSYCDRCAGHPFRNKAVE